MVQARRIDDDRSSTRCAWFFNGIPWGGNRWCCCVTNQRPRVHNKSQLELPPKAYDDMKDFGIRYSESAHILARPEESTIGCLPRVYTVGHLQGLPRLYKYGDPKSQSLFPVYRSDEPPAPIHICTVLALIFHSSKVHGHSQVPLGFTRGVPLVDIVPRCTLQVVPYL